MVTLAVDWEKHLKDAEDLPSSPMVASRVIDVVRSDHVSHAEIEGIALLDPALAVKLLRLANSSLFGAAGRVASMSHAVARVEIHAARLTLLGFQLQSQEQLPAYCWSLWRRSRATATVCRKLARLFPEVNPDEAEVVGLIANLGMFLWLVYGHEDQISDPRDSEAARFELLARSTEQGFGMSHAQMAAKLFARWSFPEVIVHAVDAHLDMGRVELLPGRDREMARVLHLATGIVGALISGKRADTNYYATLLQRWAHLGNDSVVGFQDGLATELAQGDALYTPHAFQADKLVGDARRELMEISIAAASDLARTTKKAQESQKQIDNLRKQRDLLEQQVTTDPLTGIGNRKFFDQRIMQELERCRRHGMSMALIMFDLDRFKNLNDEFGHVAGDEVLRQVAAAIRKCLRSSDIFTRYGGEEFAVIAPETDLEGALASAQRMRRCLEELTIPSDVHQLKITASFGVACVLDAQRFADVDSLLRIADKFLYQAKGDGRNLVCGGIA